MKIKGFSIGIVFLVVLVFTTCTKDETLLTPDGELSTLKSASFEHAVFDVSPNGSDDTDNIITAFEAAIAEGPGSIVYLTEGVFYTSRPITVANFNGTFMGAGKDKTIVQNIDNDAFPLISDVHPPGIGGGILPDMFTFYSDGDNMATTLLISDMTIKFEGKTVEYFAPWWHLPFDWLNACISIYENINDSYEQLPINATVKNVNFRGELLNPGTNLHFGLMLVGEMIFDSEKNYLGEERIKVNSDIEACNFSSSYFGASVYRPEDSKVLIQNNQFEHIIASGYLSPEPEKSHFLVQYNHFGNIFGTGFYCYSSKESQSLIQYNHFENILDKGYFSQYPDNSQEELYKNIFDMDGNYAVLLSNFRRSVNFEYPGKLLIHHNDFNIRGGTGIYIRGYIIDSEFRKDLDVQITSNNFSLINGRHGIACFLSEDVIVSNNKFSGNAYSAVWANYTNRMLILGDNINNLTSSIGFPIQLWRNTTNCTVIGNTRTNVLDEGTDNILVGVNNMGNPPGSEIREAMEEKLEKFHPSFSRGR